MNISDKQKIIDINNICIHFGSGSSITRVLSRVSYSFYEGERYAIVGQSGSGKSSILHVLGLLDKASSGNVVFAGKDVGNMSDREITMIRNKDIGFVYQAYNLLYDFSPLENVALPILIAGYSKKDAFAKAEDLLCMVGLQNKIHCLCRKMSGGEQQRVAIARAMANSPKVVIADEPTGNLDPKTGDHIFRFMMDFVREKNATLIMATHNMSIADNFENKITICNESFV